MPEDIPIEAYEPHEVLAQTMPVIKINCEIVKEAKRRWYADPEVYHINDPHPVLVQAIRELDTDELVCEVRHPLHLDKNAFLREIIESHNARVKG